MVITEKCIIMPQLQIKLNNLISDAVEAVAKLPKQTAVSAYFNATTKEMKDRAHPKFIIECGLPKGPALTVRTVPY